MSPTSPPARSIRSISPAVVSARAPDGVIEAVEQPGAARFCLGVQWHPEFRIDAGDRALFAAFVADAAG